MAEYELPIGGSEAWDAYHAADDFTQGYVEAMFFTEANPDSEDLAEASVADLSIEAWRKIKADCNKFQASSAFIAAKGDEADTDWDEQQTGRDFWYTRNGHGCSFWDGDYAEPHATALDAVSKVFGEVCLYRGDDGKLYLQ